MVKQEETIREFAGIWWLLVGTGALLLVLMILPREPPQRQTAGQQTFNTWLNALHPIPAYTPPQDPLTSYTHHPALQHMQSFEESWHGLQGKNFPLSALDSLDALYTATQRYGRYIMVLEQNERFRSLIHTLTQRIGAESLAIQMNRYEQISLLLVWGRLELGDLAGAIDLAKKLAAQRVNDPKAAFLYAFALSQQDSLTPDDHYVIRKHFGRTLKLAPNFAFSDLTSSTIRQQLRVMDRQFANPFMAKERREAATSLYSRIDRAYEAALAVPLPSWWQRTQVLSKTALAAPLPSWWRRTQVLP